VRAAHSQSRSETSAPTPAPLPHFCHLGADLTLPLRGHPCAGAYARAINAAACSVERTKVPRRPEMRIGRSCRNKRAGWSESSEWGGFWNRDPRPLVRVPGRQGACAIRAFTRPARSAPLRDVCFGTCALCREEQTGHPRIVMAMRAPKHHDKTVEGYRQLAEKCRQNACTVSAEKERSRLLEMAQIWDLIAERIGRRSAISVSGSVHWPMPKSFSLRLLGAKAGARDGAPFADSRRR
jgi:hypothetical protein